ncbi:MAG: LysE family translocator [Chloroflexota bacterium]|nr:LysE family translocator [Chloroflexota bacterium]
MQFLLLGLSLGLSAGLSPGPLMTLVITTSLRDGFWQGFLVAMAPILTDLPIILLSIFVLGRLPDWILPLIGIVGSGYIITLGWETVRDAQHASLRQPGADAETQGNSSKRSLGQGATVNLLNPHPYLFWATVGGPTLLAAFSQNPLYAVAFLLGFYTLLIGSKIGVAALVASQSHLLTDTWYRRILLALGVLLIGLGLLVAWQTVSGALG